MVYSISVACDGCHTCMHPVNTINHSLEDIWWFLESETQNLIQPQSCQRSSGMAQNIAEPYIRGLWLKSQCMDLVNNAKHHKFFADSCMHVENKKQTRKWLQPQHNSTIKDPVTLQKSFIKPFKCGIWRISMYAHHEFCIQYVGPCLSNGKH